MIRNLFLILATLVAATIVVYVSGQYPPRQSQPAKELLEMNTDVNCNPRTHTCTAVYNKKLVQLRLTDSVNYLKPFRVTLTPQGFAPEKIKNIILKFTMLNMEMGFNQFIMTEQKTSDWQGQAILPVCVTGRTDWKVAVWLETDKKVYRAEYQFEVDK